MRTHLDCMLMSKTPAVAGRTGEIGMLAHAHRSATAQVAAVVADVLAKHGVDGPVAADADLGRYGMTSIDMVALMLGVEAEFDVSIPAAEITLKNFSSIAAMASLVARLRPSAGSAAPLGPTCSP